MMAELLSAGHSYQAVMEEYCIDELSLHYEAMVRTSAKEQKRLAVAVRAATQSDKKGWQKYMKSLGDIWKDIEFAAGRSISTPGTFFAGLTKVKGSRPRKGNRDGND